MNEESTPSINQPNIKEEISGDEEHTPAPQESTIVIESTDPREIPEPAGPHVEEAETGPKQFSFDTT